MKRFIKKTAIAVCIIAGITVTIEGYQLTKKTYNDVIGVTASATMTVGQFGK